MDKGEVQISDKERQTRLDTLYRDVAMIVADKCVHPDTKIPYAVSVIEKAMQESHVNIVTSKTAKQQVLDVGIRDLFLGYERLLK